VIRCDRVEQINEAGGGIGVRKWPGALVLLLVFMSIALFIAADK
jgi:hypothetical protein